MAANLVSLISQFLTPDMIGVACGEFCFCSCNMPRKCITVSSVGFPKLAVDDARAFDLFKCWQKQRVPRGDVNAIARPQRCSMTLLRRPSGLLQALI